MTARSCAPITTLTCAPGFKSTTDGCPQASAPAAVSVPRGRCVPIAAPSFSCGPIVTLTCLAGFELTTDGCKQASAPDAIHAVLRATFDRKASLFVKE